MLAAVVCGNGMKASFFSRMKSRARLAHSVRKVVVIILPRGMLQNESCLIASRDLFSMRQCVMFLEVIYSQKLQRKFDMLVHSSPQAAH